MTRKIIFNGKFLMAPPTGVHRVAEELICALDDLSAEDPSIRERFDFEVFAPRKLHHVLSLKTIGFTQGGIFSWIPWEQFDLPRYAPRATRVSLCNLGPAVSRNAVTMVHDAQVYLSPASYSKPFRIWYKFIQPLIGRRHKTILTVSHYSKEQLVTYGVAPADKIHVIHNGVDHILRTTSDPAAPGRLGLSPRGYVLSLANAQAHKNIKVLLRAFADPRLSSLHLVLFGAASRSDLEALIDGPLPDNVRLVGKISDPELRGLYEQALCLAFPSTTEGFGLPPLEAMLLGCPAIVAPCGSLPEVCGDATIYADPDDPADWVVKIKNLCDNEEAWMSLRKKAQVHAGQFTWKRAAQNLLQLL
ncbi:D-inositol-3-phosphate glycosyltransferase (plasmid) [Asticcacaulis sp. MM231]|uniref:glycosyltransferase family 4 protein n=1 Tax=Asticcacaulis sp. MM231 TaxID=3157666 RepID=UPI0032D5AFA7